MTTPKAILVALDRVAPLMLPERSLWIDVNATLAIPVTITEFRQAIGRLESSRHILSIRDQLDDTLKYALTDLGLAALLRS